MLIRAYLIANPKLYFCLSFGFKYTLYIKEICFLIPNNLLLALKHKQLKQKIECCPHTGVTDTVPIATNKNCILCDKHKESYTVYTVHPKMYR